MKAAPVLEAVIKQLLPPPAAPPAHEAKLQAVVEAAKTAEPILPDGHFPETWDGGKTWHSSSTKSLQFSGHTWTARIQAEMASLQAIVDLDQARIALHDRFKCPASYAAVRAGWLKQLAMLIPHEWTTAQVRLQPSVRLSAC